MCRSCARCALARHSSQFLSAITLHELELGVLLAERRDPTQGALLRHWLQQAVVPAFAGRILAVERCSATALVHSLVVVTRNLADFEATGVRTPPNVPLLCLWAWRGLLAALWEGAEECCRFASGEGIICLLPAACCLSSN